MRHADDGRPKIELNDVKEVNHTYTYEDEATVLTHVDSGQCRQACGIKDADTFSAVRCCPFQYMCWVHCMRPGLQVGVLHHENQLADTDP